MKAQFALGAEVDIVSKDELDDARDDILDFMKRDKVVRPSYLVQSGAITAVGSPFSGILEIGSPPTGRLWNVLGFCLCGESDTAVSSAGSVALFIGDRPTTGIPTMSQLRQAMMTVPATSTFGQKAQWCGSSQTIFFKVNALVGPAQIIGNVWVAEYRDDEILERSGR